jgi:hypothetical protein
MGIINLRERVTIIFIEMSVRSIIILNKITNIPHHNNPLKMAITTNISANQNNLVLFFTMNNS